MGSGAAVTTVLQQTNGLLNSIQAPNLLWKCKVLSHNFI